MQAKPSLQLHLDDTAGRALTRQRGSNGRMWMPSKAMPRGRQLILSCHQGQSKTDEMRRESTSSWRGLRLLEWTNGIVPQSSLVTAAKFGWKSIWLTFMRELAPQSDNGSYSRPKYAFQHRIGDKDFPFESGRYAVYLGGPCPWCHRVKLALALRGLEDDFIIIQAVDAPEKASRGGWVFDSPEPVFGCRDLRGVYDASSVGGFTGRCTAPLVVDVKQRRVVCNESSIIVENLNNISSHKSSQIDLRPAHLLDQIEIWNDTLYDAVNNGVYRCGFATTQSAYDVAERQLFKTLEDVDAHLANQRFLCGEKFTEADLRLFPTATRFDAVYAPLFKCCRKGWRDFANLQRWLRDCSQLPLPNKNGRLLDTVDIDDCRRSYFSNLFPLNPSGIVPNGPGAVDLLLTDKIALSVDSRDEHFDAYWVRQ